MFGRAASTRWVATVSVCCVCGIIGFLWWIYHVVCTPHPVLALPFNVCVVLAVWSYLKVALTDPGTPSCPEWEAWAAKRPSLEAAASAAEEGRPRVVGSSIDASGPGAGDAAAGVQQPQPLQLIASPPRRADVDDEKEACMPSQVTSACEVTGPALRAAARRSAQRLRCWRPGEVLQCPDCKIERPERAHHCNQCGFCVLRMDHHCPWIGNCIGWRNHKFFLLLLWWGFGASMTWLLTLRGPDALQALDLFGIAMALEHQPSVLPAIGVLLSMSFMLITGGMFACSSFMMFRNATTIEELFPGDNPYQLPSWLDNTRQVLGEVDARLWLPLEPLGRTSNGVEFPVASKGASTAARAALAAASGAQGSYGTVEKAEGPGVVQGAGASETADRGSGGSAAS